MRICLEIQKPRSKPFVVATWYRPPDSPIGIFSPSETLIGKLDSENIEYFLMGDLNCDMIATRYDNNICKINVSLIFMVYNNLSLNQPEQLRLLQL